MSEFVITCPRCNLDDVEVLYTVSDFHYEGSEATVFIFCNACGYEEPVE